MAGVGPVGAPRHHQLATLVDLSKSSVRLPIKLRDHRKHNKRAKRAIRGQRCMQVATARYKFHATISRVLFPSEPEGFSYRCCSVLQVGFRFWRRWQEQESGGDDATLLLSPSKTIQAESLAFFTLFLFSFYLTPAAPHRPLLNAPLYPTKLGSTAT